MVLITIFELVGTIAFSISGALLGMKKHLDMFGVVFIAITTAVGGGIIRDILIGNAPPDAFRAPIFCLISCASALLVGVFYKKIIRFNNIILIFDAIGLGIFTSVGANTAIQHGMSQPFIVVSMGLMTGVGGGILRDVFLKDIPMVFKKDIYAISSIVGALVLYYTNIYFPILISMYACSIVIFILRVLSIKHKLNLPVYTIELLENEE